MRNLQEAAANFAQRYQNRRALLEQSVLTVYTNASGISSYALNMFIANFTQLVFT